MTELHTALQALDIDPEIDAAVLEILASSSPLAYPTRAKDVVPLIPEDGAQIAVYVLKRRISVAMPTEEAARLKAALGVGVHRRNGPTLYVHATAVELGNSAVREGMVRAALESLEWCRTRLVADRRAGTVNAQPKFECCPACNIELRPSGLCAEDTCPLCGVSN